MRKDLSTKIISLLFAIFLWFYIIQVQNPEIEKNIKDIPVQFTKSGLEQRGLTLINDKEVQIDIKVKGQRKYLSNIKKEDITIVADATNISSTGTHKISMNVILPYGNIEILEQNPQYITVTVDEIISVKKDVVVNLIGEPRSGYCVSDYKVSPHQVRVKGPKSIVNTIENLAVEVDVGGKNEDITLADAPIQFVGTSGETFNTTYVTLEQDVADVHCTISKEKTVAIDVNLAEGINYVLDETSVKSIEIAGAADVIENIDKVSTEKITRGMISAKGEVEVKLVLPSGVVSKDGNTVKLKLKKVSADN